LFVGLFLFYFLFFPEVSNHVEHDLSFRNYGVQVDNSTHGGMRCVSSSCLCRVRPGEIPDPVTSLLPSERRVSIYFSEDSSEVTSSQNSKIDRAQGDLSDLNPREITIIGYTDGCGSRDYNTNLARERMETVRDRVRRQFPGRRLRTVVAGEGSRGHDARARRVDIVFHTRRTVTTEIEKIPADVYLIDASGSMWSQWRRWTDVINASFEPGSRIYLSTALRCPGSRSLDNVSPGGRTEIWYSYWTILDYMSPGETLLIISDFDSDIPLTRSESSVISRKVQSRQITVRTVNL